MIYSINIIDNKYSFNRESNIELFRILVMMSIIAHHMIMNTAISYNLLPELHDVRNVSLWTLGMWGKIGVNCFVLITGWYMCTSAITLRKFLKLLLEVYFYKFFNFILLFAAGMQTLSLKSAFYMLMPIGSITSNDFVSCYLVFFLMIPFLNIMIHNLTEKMHKYLVLLGVGILCLWNQLYWIEVNMSYLLWFPTLYFVASYFRLYPESTKKISTVLEKTPLLWVCLSIASVVGVLWFLPHTSKDIHPYYFVADSNAILAFFTSLSLFMYFKSIHIKKSKLINILGACSFGVLLFHTTSGMRYVLFERLLKIPEVLYDNQSIALTITYFLLFVIVVYNIGAIIDILRMYLCEKPLFNKIDKHLK